MSGIIKINIYSRRRFDFPVIIRCNLSSEMRCIIILVHRMGENASLFSFVNVIIYIYLPPWVSTDSGSVSGVGHTHCLSVVPSLTVGHLIECIHLLDLPLLVLIIHSYLGTQKGETCLKKILSLSSVSRNNFFFYLGLFSITEIFHPHI